MVRPAGELPRALAPDESSHGEATGRRYSAHRPAERAGSVPRSDAPNHPPGLLTYRWQASSCRPCSTSAATSADAGRLSCKGVSCPHRGCGLGVQRVALPPGGYQLSAVGIEAKEAAVYVLVAGLGGHGGQQQSAAPALLW